MPPPSGVEERCCDVVLLRRTGPHGHGDELACVGVLSVDAGRSAAVLAWTEGADDRFDRLGVLQHERFGLEVAATALSGEDTLGDVTQPPPASCCKASFSLGGKVLPRFSARRRIPAEAFWLKQYLSNPSCQGSRTCESEDATAALWDSEVLSVKHTPDGDPFRSDTDAACFPSTFGDVGGVSRESAKDNGEVCSFV